MFRVPYAPGLDLAKRVRGVLEQEARRIRIQVKVVEGGGMPLRRRVVNTDLARGKPFPQGNCPLGRVKNVSNQVFQKRFQKSFAARKLTSKLGPPIEK